MHTLECAPNWLLKVNSSPELDCLICYVIASYGQNLLFPVVNLMFQLVTHSQG